MQSAHIKKFYQYCLLYSSLYSFADLCILSLDDICGKRRQCLPIYTFSSRRQCGGKNKVSISALKEEYLEEQATLPAWWEEELARRDVLFLYYGKILYSSLYRERHILQWESICWETGRIFWGGEMDEAEYQPPTIKNSWSRISTSKLRFGMEIPLIRLQKLCFITLFC